MPQGRPKIETLAVAQANGYIRGSEQDQVQQYCEKFYLGKSKDPQERILSIYTVLVPSIPFITHYFILTGSFH
jgi:hypothetical protein